MKVVSVRQAKDMGSGGNGETGAMWDCMEARGKKGGGKKEEVAYLHVNKTKTMSYTNQAPSPPYSSRADGRLVCYYPGRLP